jgi:signal transduction histidine kinase
MTADVAHELRNPLAILQAQVEALIDGVYPLTTENLAPVLGQAQVLSRLVEDLRTLALADSGQLSLEPAKVDLQALAAGLIEAIRPQADAQHLRLELAGASAWAMVDRLRIEQALGNLIANALRHTPPGGEVQVRIDPPQAEGLVTLTVVDSGEGIPGEALPFVFERFYRADKARARAEGGTGLGLAITRQLVEAHGGTVTAGNRPEGGAVFTLRLPSAQAPPAVPA